MSDKISRHEQLVRAAKGRAIITACLKNADVPLTRVKIFEACGDSLNALGYTDSTLDNFLYTMGKSGLVTKVPGPSGMSYLWGTTPCAVGNAVINKAKAKQVKADTASSAVPSAAAITLDIIKSTGRVRLTINGLVIEVGVID